MCVVFGGFYFEWCVVMCVVGIGYVVFYFGFGGQCEEVLKCVVGIIDQCWIDVVVVDVVEVKFVISGVEFGDECVVVGVVMMDVEGGNVFYGDFRLVCG